jgi:hypothetical protein
MITRREVWLPEAWRAIVTALILFSAIHPTTGLAQSQRYGTFGGNVASLALYHQVGDKYPMFATVEFKGQIEYDFSGKVIQGQDSFLRLQLAENPSKWLQIKKRELVKGGVVITTEDEKVYTIYDLQSGFVAKIEPGPFVDEKRQTPKKQ